MKLSTTDAALMLAVTPARVRQLIAAGKLKAVRVGSVWAVDSKSCERMARSVRKAGRPRVRF